MKISYRQLKKIIKEALLINEVSHDNFNSDLSKWARSATDRATDKSSHAAKSSEQAHAVSNETKIGSPRAGIHANAASLHSDAAYAHKAAATSNADKTKAAEHEKKAIEHETKAAEHEKISAELKAKEPRFVHDHGPLKEIADPKYRDFSRFLKEKGFYKAKAEGSHEIWLNGKGAQLSVPSHKEIRIGTVEQILKNMGLMPDKTGQEKVWTVKDYFRHTRGQ